MQKYFYVIIRKFTFDVTQFQTNKISKLIEKKFNKEKSIEKSIDLMVYQNSIPSNFNSSSSTMLKPTSTQQDIGNTTFEE